VRWAFITATLLLAGAAFGQTKGEASDGGEGSEVDALAPAVVAAPSPTAEPAAAPRLRPDLVKPLKFVDPIGMAREDRTPPYYPRGYYRGRERFIIPQLRVAPGFSGRVSGGDDIAAFMLDLTAAVRFGLHPGEQQWALAPQLGYTLRAPGLEHQLSAGIGVGYGVNVGEHTVMFLPRFVFAPDGDPLPMGGRYGALWDFAENGFSVELSHQFMMNGDGDRAVSHDLRLSLGIDLVLLTVVLADLEGNGPGKVDWD